MDRKFFRPLPEGRSEAMNARIARALKGAKTGSRTDMDFLAVKCLAIPTSTLPTVLTIICSHLKKPQLNSSSRRPTLGEMRRAHTALLCLARLICEDRLRRTYQMTATIVKAWSGIKYWLLYIGAHHKYEDTLDEQIELNGTPRDSGPEATVCILLGAMFDCGIHELSNMILYDPTIFKLVATLWINQGLKLSYDRTADPLEIYKNIAPAPSMILSNYFTAGTQEINQTRFVEIADGDADLIGFSTVQRVRNSLRVGSVAALDLVIYSTQIYNVAFYERLDLNVAVFDNGAVHVMTKSLRKVPHWVPPYDHDPDVVAEGYSFQCKVIKKAMIFLEEAFKLARSLTRMRQSIHSGLLPALKDVFASYVPNTEKDAACLIVTDTIPYHLLMHPIVGDLVKAYRTDDLTLSKSVPLRYSREWDNMKSLIIERAICKCLFDRSRARMRRICDSCDRMFPEGILKKCGACQSKRYCSVLCQKTDWINHHRGGCGVQAAKRENTNVTLIEEEFIASAVAIDIRNCLPGLRKAAARKYPGVPLQELYFSATYDQLPSPYFDVSRYEVDKRPKNKSPDTVYTWVHYKYGGCMFTLKTDVSVDVAQPPRSSYADRAKLGISRVQKFGQQNQVLLQTVDWDEVDEIWYRAQRLGGASIWDGIEKAVTQLENEGYLVSRCSIRC